MPEAEEGWYVASQQPLAGTKGKPAGPPGVLA